MLVNNGDNQGLFRGAFMNSGFPNSLLDITHGQDTYDTIVSQTGCQESTDTLQCFRTVPLARLQNVMNALPNLFTPQVRVWLDLLGRLTDVLLMLVAQYPLGP